MVSLLFQSFSSHPSRVFHAHLSRLSRKSAAVLSVGRAHSWRAVVDESHANAVFDKRVLAVQLWKARNGNRRRLVFMAFSLQTGSSSLWASTSRGCRSASSPFFSAAREFESVFRLLGISHKEEWSYSRIIFQAPGQCLKLPCNFQL